MRSVKSMWVDGAAMVLLGLAAQCAQAENLVVMGDDGYPPVIYMADGKPAGALVDILQKVSARSGDRYDLQLVPWKRAYMLGQTGKAAVVGISSTAERMQQFDFSTPLYYDDIQIVVRKDRFFAFQELDDLKGKSIGGALGASYGETIDAAIRNGLFKMEFDTGAAMRLRKLLAGRMDAAFIGNGMAGYEAVLNGDPDLSTQRNALVVLPVPLTRDVLYLAFAKTMQKKAALERFNIALRDLRKSHMLAPLARDADGK